MTVRDNGAGYRRAAQSQGFSSLLLVLLTFAGLALVLLGVVGSEV